MPCYNVDKYIKQSIRSILEQTYKDWELVILDDCSNDNTYNIIKDFVSKNITVSKRKEHSGLIGKVKNEAISMFKKQHEYVCHVGSDDIIPEYCLELFVTNMDANKDIGAMCGNFICFNNEGKQWVMPHVANSNDFVRQTLLSYNCLFPMRFYRKDVVDKVNKYSETLSSAVDYDIALKIDEITKIVRIKEPISYFYRIHSEQVSTKTRIEQNLNAKKALFDAMIRRNIKGKIINETPPFNIKLEEESGHFIWGK